jgi:glycosyltransferase involved in cell wall biosynthesis
MMAMPYEDGASFRRGTFMACLAHGMPTITTQPAVPLAQLKHEENIYLIPPHNAQALTEAIITLQNDSTLRERIAHGSLELSDEFTWDKIAKRTTNFFETLLSKDSA